MTTRYGFELTKSGKQGSVYQHLYLRVFCLEKSSWGDSWRHIADVSWQTDTDSDYWYACTIQLNYTYASDFTLGVKFLQRVDAASMCKAAPAEFVGWLTSIKGVRLVYNMRRSTVIRESEFFVAKQMMGFRFYAHQGEYGYVDMIEADSLVQAAIQVEQKYGERYHKNRDTWVLQHTNESVNEHYLTVENWLEIAY